MSLEGLSLRLSLAVLGVAIVIGVYLFTSLRKKRENRRNFERDFSRIDLSDVILQEDKKDDYPSEELSALRNDVSGQESPNEQAIKEELPQIRNDMSDPKLSSRITGKKEKDQLDLFSSDAQNYKPEEKKNIPLRELETETVENETGLINLFVESRKNTSFSGTEIARYLNRAGMRHGEMSIFHLYEENSSELETVLFSAANMYEPGTFDLNLMDSFETKGIVFFMQVNIHRDNDVVLSRLLDIASNFSESINGSLNVEPGTPLDEYHILKLRRRVAVDKDENL